MGRRGFLGGLLGLLGLGAAKGAVPCEVAGNLRVSGPEVLERVVGVAHPLSVIPMDDKATLSHIYFNQDTLEYHFSDGTVVHTPHGNKCTWLDGNGHIEWPVGVPR
jgi:hypothetical protein